MLTRISAPALLLLVTFSAACDRIAAEESAGPPVDGDGDGYYGDGDCDDQNANLSPVAAERCDGYDNDCDGLIDDDPVDGLLWYADADGDGFGSIDYVVVRCEEEPGFVDNGADCQDALAGVNPGADEVCDGIDNDCDGAADEPEAVDAPLWYADQDGDGFGNPYAPEPACEAPEGYVESATDCDDADPERSPVALELCDEGEIDEDCDGLVNDADTAWNPEFWYRDADQDGHGDAAVPTTACVVPVGYTADADDCDDADPSVHPAAAETCGDGVDEDCDGAVDEDGVAIAWYTDADGDGYGDAALGEACAALDGAVSAPGDCDDGDAAVSPEAPETWYDGIDQDCDAGSDYDADGDGALAEGWGEDCDDSDADRAPSEVEVCGSGLDEDCDGETDPCETLYSVETRDEGDHAGAALARLGDLDGDGLDELVISAPRDDGADEDAGLIAVLRSAEEDEAVLSHALWQLEGADSGDRAGAALATADVDGDGALDLIVGAPGSDAGLEGAGAFHTVLAFDYGTENLADSDGWWTGRYTGDGAGAALSGAGDLDEDGFGDLLVGAPDAGDAAGAAFLVTGPTTGAYDLSWADTFLYGEAAGDRAGEAVLGGIDVDGDGLEDALIGGPLALDGEARVGAVWLVLDPPSGALALSDADARWLGADGDGRLGASLADAGDVDGDGLQDLLLAAPDAGEGGEVWLLAGGPAASGALDLDLAAAQIATTRAGAGLGAAMVGLGDLDGDGLGEIALGAPGEDAMASDAGATWVLAGGASGALVVERDAAARMDGASAGQRAGSALVLTGDWDGDGAADIAVGAPASDAAPDVRGGLLIWRLWLP